MIGSEFVSQMLIKDQKRGCNKMYICQVRFQIVQYSIVLHLCLSLMLKSQNMFSLYGYPSGGNRSFVSSFFRKFLSLQPNRLKSALIWFVRMIFFENWFNKCFSVIEWKF